MSEKKPTIVVALGGNAILADDASAKGQKERLKQTVAGFSAHFAANSQYCLASLPRKYLKASLGFC